MRTLPLALLLTTLTASAQTNIWLTWEHSISTNVVSYRIWQGNGPNSYTTNWLVQYTNYAKVNNLYFNTPYYFSVTAIDTVGQQSDFSNEVNWTYNIRPAPPTMLQIAEEPPIPPTNVPSCTMTMFANQTLATTGGDILSAQGYLASPFLSDIQYGTCEVDLLLNRGSGAYDGMVAVGITEGSMPSAPSQPSASINMGDIPLGGTNWITFQNQTFSRIGTNWIVLKGNLNATSNLRWMRNSSVQVLGTNKISGVWRSTDGVNWTLVTGSRRLMFVTRSQ